jgi:hypothetical protein
MGHGKGGDYNVSQQKVSNRNNDHRRQKCQVPHGKNKHQVKEITFFAPPIIKNYDLQIQAVLLLNAMQR